MSQIYAFLSGLIIATLGGLIGLGGAEFRLPVLKGLFKFKTIDAITINLVVSLVTVIFSFLFRSGFSKLGSVGPNWGVVINIIAGSLLGAYIGVGVATKLNEKTLNRIVVVFLIFLSGILLSHSFIIGLQGLQIDPVLRIPLGLAAGIMIGVFSSMLGVAGGEMIIPTIILIYGIDIKMAGNLSLAISMPTILMGLFKYQRQHRLAQLNAFRPFIAIMSLGSIVGALLGSYLLRFVSTSFLYVFLGCILIISAIKLFSNGEHR